MNIKENWKRFWTLSRHHEGFTLVELIVVIAILAILAGVGVPAYSGYIKRANMTADQALVSEIKHVLTLASYQNDFVGGAMVKITKDGADIVPDGTADAAAIDKAMKDAFGDNWNEVCKLKYDGWTGMSVAQDVVNAYNATTLAGNEKELLERMDVLTSAMADFFGLRNEADLPPVLADILKDQNVDLKNSTAVANAAVVALAQTMNSSTGVKEDVHNILAGIGGDIVFEADGTPNMSATTDKLNTVYKGVYSNYEGDNNDMALLASAATIYAYAESYARFAESEQYGEPLEILNNAIESIQPTDGAAVILNKIANAYGEMAKGAVDPATQGGKVALKWNTPENGYVENNTTGVFAVMDALNNSSDVLKENLTSETFYTDGTAANLVDTYLTIGGLPEGNQLADGEVAVVITKNGAVASYPAM